MCYKCITMNILSTLLKLIINLLFNYLKYIIPYNLSIKLFSIYHYIIFNEVLYKQLL